MAVLTVTAVALGKRSLLGVLPLAPSMRQKGPGALASCGYQQPTQRIERKDGHCAFQRSLANAARQRATMRIAKHEGLGLV